MDKTAQGGRGDPARGAKAAHEARAAKALRDNLRRRKQGPAGVRPQSSDPSSEQSSDRLAKPGAPAKPDL